MKADLQLSELFQNPATSPETLYDQYHTTVSNLLDVHAPLKIRKYKNTPHFYLSEEYLKAKRLKRQYERIWRRSKTPLNRARFRRQINLCNRLVEKERNRQYSERISQVQGNPRKLWGEINKMLHRVNESVLPDGPVTEVCENFSEYFIDKIQKIRDSFSCTKTVMASAETCNPDANTPFSNFTPVSEDEVRKIIVSSPCKSCSLDPWPTFLLKDCLDIIIIPITKLMNMCLSHGVFPAQFKTAVVTPLIKKPTLSKNDMKNYRPVSNLNFLSKLLERLVVKQLQDHLVSNGLENPFQSAYKTGHSTETALLKLQNDIHLNMSGCKTTALVLLDLSAAFDTIDHSTLLDRLSGYFGLKDTVLKWFTSYLSSRKQMVMVNNVVSTEKVLQYGVPQGSVLGPVLFSMYTTPLSDIIKIFPRIHHLLYADDTQIYIDISPGNFNASLKQLQDCLLAVQQWMDQNKLKLNPDKT